MFHIVGRWRDTAAKRAAGRQPVELDSIGAQARKLHQLRLGSQRILLAGPDRQPAVGELRRDVDRLHRGMMQPGRPVDGFDRSCLARAKRLRPRLPPQKAPRDRRSPAPGPRPRSVPAASRTAGPPSSNSGSSASSAWRACHQPSAITATARSVVTTSTTPGIDSAGALSTETSLPPCTGAERTAACSMPGSLKSMPYPKLPLVFGGMSARSGEVPAMRHVAGSLKGGSRGTRNCDAASASSPKLVLCPGRVAPGRHDRSARQPAISLQHSRLAGLFCQARKAADPAGSHPVSLHPLSPDDIAIDLPLGIHGWQPPAQRGHRRTDHRQRYVREHRRGAKRDRARLRRRAAGRWNDIEDGSLETVLDEISA